MPCCTRNAAIACSVILSLLCAGATVIAVIGAGQVAAFLREGIIQQRLVTSKNSTGYDQWASSDYKDAPPQYFTVYMFNVTNPEEVEKGEKPKLNQVGPFIYDYHYHFFNVTWSDDLNTVQNMKFERYNWHPEGSVSDPKTTELTLLNIPYSAIRAGIDANDTWYTSLAFDLITSAASQSILTRATVHDFVWGYDSPFLSWVNKNLQPLPSTEFKLQNNDTSESDAFKNLNGTYDVYYTGNNDSSLFNYYSQWHGLKNLDVWSDEGDSNIVKGYDGTGFSIQIPDDKNLTVFVDTLYRHLELWYNTTEEVKGITLRRYWLAPDNFWNVSMGNTAYHLYAPQGLSNMTGPMDKQQVPIFMSLPLFLQSDESYLQAVDFLPPHDKPNMTLHNTEIMVEPTTGLTMKAAKRVQVNCRMDSTLILYPNLPTTYFPVAWFELSSTISDPLAAQFRNTVLLAKLIIYYCPFVMGGLAGLTFLFAAYLSFVAHKLRSRKSGYDIIDTIQ